MLAMPVLLTLMMNLMAPDYMQTLYEHPLGYLIVTVVVALLGIAVLVTYSPQNGVILLVIAFLVSPVGLPMAAAWLVSKVQDLRYAIQDAVYG